MTTLTKTEKFLLNEIDSVPDKVVSFNLLRQAARHLTITGFRRAVTKMEDARLIGRTEDDRLTLTFGGMCAMRENGMEVQ